MGLTPTDEFRTVSVPAGACMFITRNAEGFASVGAGSGTMSFAAGAAGFYLRETVSGEVPPAPTLHALCKFLFCLLGLTLTPRMVNPSLMTRLAASTEVT